MESDPQPTHQNGSTPRFPELPIVSPSPLPSSFPSLPIIAQAPPQRLSTREKYGSLFYLGLVGLVVVLGLLGWFAHGVWSLRGVWSNIYALHDEARPEHERVEAAWSLSRDPSVNQRQRWDICLRKPLPPLARYVLAESLSAEAALGDPRAYALMIARSPDWPDWLRLLLTRPMAYAVIDGGEFPRVALEELRANPDRAISLWASFVLSQADPNDQGGRPALVSACQEPGWARDLACLLRDAASQRGRPVQQHALLDQATAWIRSHHPASRQVWNGRSIDAEGRLRSNTPPTTTEESHPVQQSGARSIEPNTPKG